MALAAGPGTDLTAGGSPEAEAIEALVALVEAGFGERTDKKKGADNCQTPRRHPRYSSQFVKRNFEIFKAMSRNAAFKPSPVEVS